MTSKYHHVFYALFDGGDVHFEIRAQFGQVQIPVIVVLVVPVIITCNLQRGL